MGSIVASNQDGQPDETSGDHSCHDGLGCTVRSDDFRERSYWSWVSGLRIQGPDARWKARYSISVPVNPYFVVKI